MTSTTRAFVCLGALIALSAAAGCGPGAPPGQTLKALIERRQAYLLEWLAANSRAAAL